MRTQYSEVETVFVNECLALARDVYQSPVRINIRQVDDMWAVEVVRDAEMRPKRGSWPTVEDQLLAAQATDRLEALKQLRDSLARVQHPQGIG